MATIDIISFNGEYDLLEIRLNILDKFVDQFIVVEALTTFSGNPKPLYYEVQKERYAKWHNKIKYFVVDENDEVLWEQARQSPNTKGAEHWKREWVQKESIKKALTHLKDNDLCLIGDVDEIPDPLCLKDYEDFGILKFNLRVYAYYLNLRSSEIFHGTLCAKYKDIKNACLNHLRSDINTYRTAEEQGWHFTSQGGLDEVRRKLNDSYTSDSYNSPEVQAMLASRFGKSDYMGRGFTFTKDESDLPKYLKANREKYGRLFN